MNKTWSINDYITAIELFGQDDGNILSLKREYIPREAPEEYYKNWNKYNKKVTSLFFRGGELKKKSEYKDLYVIGYFKLLITDMDLSHEKKVAICAQVYELFFED